MPELRCSFGQDGTEADHMAPVILTPANPTLGDFGTAGGKIKLISNSTAMYEDMDPVGPWLPHELTAKFPAQNPGTDRDEERFTIEVTPNGGETYSASPVWVTGLSGSGWPPTHRPDIGDG
jgi:hypothetical protein